MNKLYSRIYKAINEGIQKALLIPFDQDDVSINYSYHKINNDMNLLPYYVDNLLNDNDDVYWDILKFHNENTQYTYKVKDFDELFDIFNKIQNITDDIDLSWIDMANAVTFIMNDKSEMPLNKIDNKDNIVFIKFDNIKKLNHSVIIHKDLLIDNKVWNTKLIEIVQDQNNTINGYENTKIIEKFYNLNEYPVFEYCVQQSYLNYEGYLPAIEELKFLSENIDLINYILKCVNIKKLNIKSDVWWSSTQYSAIYAWFLTNGLINNGIYKYDSGQVLPLFHKKIKN